MAENAADPVAEAPPSDPATSAGDGDAPAAGPGRPRLWSPDAAAKWCLLFGPAFGAAVHAANWRTLGRPDRARANLAWVGAVAAFLAANLAPLVFPNLAVADPVPLLVGVGLLFGWYVTQGHAQVRYVQESLPGGYVRRGWGRPLLLAAAAVGAYVAAVAVLAVAIDTPNAADLAAEVRPLVADEWRRDAARRGASVRAVTLTYQGDGLYTGFVDATVAGEAERLPLTVVYEGGSIRWQVGFPPEQ